MGKVLIVSILAALAANASAQECPAPPEGYDRAPPEHLDNGGIACNYKDSDGNTQRHTVVYPDPKEEKEQEKKKEDPKGGGAAPPPKGKKPCEASYKIKLEMWNEIQDAREQAQTLKNIGKPGQFHRTFATAFIMDESCKVYWELHGAYIEPGPHHAERVILDEIAIDAEGSPGRHLDEGHTVLWMIDQLPCQDPKKEPPAGFCSTELKAFAAKYKVDQRVYVTGPVVKVPPADGKGKPKKDVDLKKVKDYAIDYYYFPKEKKPKVKAENFKELLDFRVVRSESPPAP